jgi:Uma2 family endonuclease
MSDREFGEFCQLNRDWRFERTKEGDLIVMSPTGGRTGRRNFTLICPDFVVELRSPSDDMGALKEKMQEYVKNGALLGWLIDPVELRVYIYQPGQDVQCFENPGEVSGEPVLPGFVLDVRRIW